MQETIKFEDEYNYWCPNISEYNLAKIVWRNLYHFKTVFINLSSCSFFWIGYPTKALRSFFIPLLTRSWGQIDLFLLPRVLQRYQLADDSLLRETHLTDATENTFTFFFRTRKVSWVKLTLWMTFLDESLQDNERLSSIILWFLPAEKQRT